MFGWFDQNRRWLKKGLKSAPEGKFRDYLLTGLPNTNQLVNDTDFLVLDFETTGLDVKKDHIISAGFTEIKHKHILLGSSEHHLVSTPLRLNSENVSIHHLTDDMLDQGMSIAELIEYLLVKMKGKVIVAHYKKIEYHFIQQACQAIYKLQLPMIMLDTLLIEKHKRERLNIPMHTNQLRLFNLRAAYNLPRYNAHNAMEDAIATAELLIAQIKVKQMSGEKLRIRDLL